MKFFIPAETCDSNYYMIKFDGFSIFEGTKDFCYTSSYHLIGARLLGLSYGDFLKFCQSKGAKLRGNKGYTYPIWKNRKDCQGVCNILEKEWLKVIKAINFKAK